MAKIIKLDASRKKPQRIAQPESKGCEHKHVIAYTVFRTVHCSSCGAMLDPFDVLVDMLKGYVPPDGHNQEEKRLEKELKRRRKEKIKKS